MRPIREKGKFEFNFDRNQRHIPHADSDNKLKGHHQRAALPLANLSVLGAAKVAAVTEVAVAAAASLRTTTNNTERQ